MKQLLTNCTIFDGEKLHRKRSLLIDGRKIIEHVGADPASVGADSIVDLNGNLLAPGLVDLQVNGGGGVLFNDSPNIAGLRSMADAHRGLGTTAFLPTLISDEVEVMQQGIAAVSEAIEQELAGVIGIHLEGPYLNPAFKGVHDAARIQSLDEQAMALLASLNNGCTLVTLAPELLAPGIISSLIYKGVIVFAGHSAASYEQTQTALDAGLRGFTHLFNAMPMMLSREPGIIGAALDDPDSFFGIIADGHHLHPATLRIAIAAKPTGKAILVTDAMPCVGATDKSFMLNGETITATGGRCLTPAGVLAGSDLGMIEAVRNTSEFGGVDQFEALRMASAYPARAIGLADQMGHIRPGYRANMIELDESFKVRRSWIDGAMREVG